jgi:hypothetical protein
MADELEQAEKHTRNSRHSTSSENVPTVAGHADPDAKRDPSIDSEKLDPNEEDDLPVRPPMLDFPEGGLKAWSVVAGA